jgi:hypothetical protein
VPGRIIATAMADRSRTDNPAAKIRNMLKKREPASLGGTAALPTGKRRHMPIGLLAHCVFDPGPPAVFVIRDPAIDVLMKIHAVDIDLLYRNRLIFAVD